MLRGWRVTLDRDGTLRKHSDEDLWSAGALLQVADPQRFQLSVTVNRAACALGIVAANATMPRGPPFAQRLNTFAAFVEVNPPAFLLGTCPTRSADKLRMRSCPAAGDLVLETETTLTRMRPGESLTMEYEDGRLTFRREGQVFEAGPVPPGDYRPCVLLAMNGGQVHVQLSRKRRRDEPGAGDQQRLRLWQERDFPDAVVRCSGRDFPVHRCILCVGSTVFERMLKCEMQEAREAAIDIQDATPEAVEALLRYIYTAELPKSGDLLPELHSLAQRYTMQELAEETGWEMVQGLTPDNVLARVSALHPYADSPHTRGTWSRLMEMLRAEGNQGIFQAFVDGALRRRP